MPQFTVTGRYQQIHQFRWTGDAPSPLAAERRIRMLLMSAAESDEDLTSTGLQLYGTYCGLQNVKVQEVTPKGPKGQPAPIASTTPNLHPLYLLHTAWRVLSVAERQEFLAEMLTPNERRCLALGLEEEP